MNKLLALPALLIVGLLAHPVASQPTITKTEIRTAPPEQTHRRLRDLVWRMFEREDHRRSRAPRNRLDQLSFRTHPRATEVPGLCRYDSARVEFAPVRRGATSAETPVRPIGITAQSFYRFVRPPTSDYHELSDFDRLPEADGCQSLDPSRLSFFSATDERRATDNYLAFLSLQQALRDRRNVPLACNLSAVESASCKELLVSWNAERIASMESCEATTFDESCHLIWLDEYQIRITRSATAAGRPILRAAVDALITFSHERVD